MMDAHFISGDFFSDNCIPRDKLYLLKYFTTEIQKQFIRHMHIFGDHRLFGNISGIRCGKRFPQILLNRMHELENVHKIAKDAMDLEVLESIEKGRYTTNWSHNSHAESQC